MVSHEADSDGVGPGPIGDIETARQLVAKAKAAAPPPSHVADQLEAATRDVREFLRRFALTLAAEQPNENWQTHYDNDARESTDEVTARMLVALRGLRRCPHLKKSSPRPTWVRLPLHRADCDRCLPTVRKPPVDEGDRCDWCGRRGVVLFMPIVIQSGPLVVIGDACPDCAAALRWFEQEPSR